MRNPSAVLLLSAFVGLTAGEACADYDMSGKWLLLHTSGQAAGRLTIEQMDGELSAPSESGSIPWTGTIDEMTGAFHLEPAFYTFPMCSTWSIDGTVAADGRAFTAVRHTGTFSGGTPTTLQCNTATADITGTRCGNTVLEDFEECDLGDATDGDCCSSSCTFDSAGTGCTSDGNVCTDDVCDGAGTCTNADRAGPCELPGGCGSGDCADGTCVVTSSLPAGTSCDLDASVCTPDTCDAEGNCEAGTSIDCLPCGTCDDVEGCIAYPLECESDSESMKLSLRTGDDPTKRSLKLSVSREGIHDPGTGIDTAVCVFQDIDGVSRPVLNVRVPADGPWELKNGRYVYKDKTRAADGVLSMTAHPERGYKVVAGRENLPLTLAFPVDAPLTARISTAPSESFSFVSVCVEQTLVTDQQSDTKYKGSYAPAP